MMKLSDVAQGGIVRVLDIKGGEMRGRLMELGFTKGVVVKVHNISPLGKAYLVECRGTILALRYNAVNLIEVEEIKSLLQGELCKI